MEDLEINFNSSNIEIYPLSNRVDANGKVSKYDILSRYPVEQNIIKLPQVALDTYFHNYSPSGYVKVVSNVENKPCINVYGHFLIYGYDINIKSNDSLYVLPQVDGNTYNGYLYLMLTIGQEVLTKKEQDVEYKYFINGLSSKQGVQKDLDIQDNPFKPSLFKALDLELAETKLDPVTVTSISADKNTYTYNFLIATINYNKTEGSTQGKWQVDENVPNTKVLFNNMSLNIKPKSQLVSKETSTTQDFLNNFFVDDGNIKEAKEGN